MRRLVAIIAMLALAAIWPAQGHAERVALVVGIGDYRHVPPLANPANDARDMAEALTRLGFRTDLVLDPDRTRLEQSLRRLGQAARGAEAAVFFYAGHAIEVGGRNWLLPVEADIESERDLRFEALDMDIVSEQLDGAARLSIVLLDACRDNPFRLRLASGNRSVAVGTGLAQLRAAVGTLVAFSTAPGTVAADGRGRNSPFTAALLRRIDTPGLELRQMLAEVRREVREGTGGRQVPWEHSALEGAFYFVPAAVAGPATAGAGAIAPRIADPEIVFWESVRGSSNPADLQAYVARYPRGMFRDLAENRLRDLAAAASPPPPAPQAAAPVARAALPQATAPAPSATPEQPARPAPPSRGPATAESLAAALAPHLGAEEARRIALLYVNEPGPLKAIAVAPARRTSWRVTAVTDGPDIGEMTLERCELAYGQACMLVAVNDRLSGEQQPRQMPRLAHAGRFDLAQVPGVATSRRQGGSDLTRYLTGAEPKAIAVHPTGRYF
ncbi:MAG: caspase family protein, partial [Myxococcaceae bacterium]|nr:caspase family protein [Myxococcaceae bacterium]